jgi:hypothetical protein
MNLAKHVFFGAVVAMASGTACSSSNSAPPPSHPPPGYWAPPAHGYHQGPLQQPGMPPPGQPPRAQAPAGQPFPWLSPMGFRLPPAPPLMAIFRPANVQRMLAQWGNHPCAPVQVAAGYWTQMDCSAPMAITRSVPFFRPQGFVRGNLPDAVNHLETGMEGPVRDQDKVGSCTAMSLAAAMDHRLRTKGITEPVSALHIWSNYGFPNMGKAGDANLDKRIAPESVWPFDPAVACKYMDPMAAACGSAYGVTPGSARTDPAIQKKKKEADAKGKYTLVGIEKLSSHDPNGIAEIIAGGDDLWVAFNMGSREWSNSSHKSGAVIPDYTPRGRSGHAVVLSGYRTRNGRKEFLIHNSWSPRWGKQGYAWIGENMVKNQLRYAYRVRVAAPGEAPTPPKPSPGGSKPKPAPSASGCAGGQVRDVVYRSCANPCAGGLPPAAGLCPPVFPGKPKPKQPPPSPSDGPSGNSCPSGEAPDVMNGQCKPLCPGGLPQIGGLCLPRIQ